MESSLKTTMLPVRAYEDTILKAVHDNSVVIITAETGAGKSTQVPQILLRHYEQIIVTQPRRLPARTLAERVAYEKEEEVGDTIGYRTAVDNVVGKNTRCMYATDGLALIRELVGMREPDVLVLDEVHEWNVNMDVLVAWCKKRIAEDAKYKLVIMSATLDANPLARYFNDAPVISVPGRTFPVEELQPGYSIESDVKRLVEQGHNVLVFQPGKSEIYKTIDQLEMMDLNAVVLPLHGQLEPHEQAACFRSYGKPKVIVSTNIAETSVTIEGITAVVDSGMERRVELSRDKSVEGLYLKPISWANSDQRKGRAGRTKPGVYLDHCPAQSRPDFPVAEILRRRLDQTVLRLAVAGVDAEELEFYHQPPREQIVEARRALKAIGCLREDGTVTSIGKKVSRFGVSVQFGRMIVEAEKLGVVADVIIIASLLEQKGITLNRTKSGEDCEHRWRALVADERVSDVMAQLKLYKIAYQNGYQDLDLAECGIHPKAYQFVRQRVELLRDAVSETCRDLSSTGDRDAILRSVCSGMVDHVYMRRYPGSADFINGDPTHRQLNNKSVVEPDQLVVGLPWDLEVKSRRGGKHMRNLITMVMAVEPKWLCEVAPQVKPLIYKWFNGQAWDDFTYRAKERPIDLDAIEAKTITIEEVEFGICSVTGDPLFAYGSPRVLVGPYGEGRFYWEWFRTREEANKALQKVYAESAEAIRIEKRKQLIRDCNNLQTQLRQCRFEPGFNELGELASLIRNLASASVMMKTTEELAEIKVSFSRAVMQFEEAIRPIRERLRAEEEERIRLRRLAQKKYAFLVEKLDCDVDDLKEFIAFAKEVRELHGNDETLRALLKEIHQAQYGWKKKKLKLFASIAGVEQAASVEAFKRVTGNERVKAWLRCIAWLMDNEETK